MKNDALLLLLVKTNTTPVICGKMIHTSDVIIETAAITSSIITENDRHYYFEQQFRIAEQKDRRPRRI